MLPLWGACAGILAGLAVAAFVACGVCLDVYPSGITSFSFKLT